MPSIDPLPRSTLKFARLTAVDETFDDLVPDVATSDVTPQKSRVNNCGLKGSDSSEAILPEAEIETIVNLSIRCLVAELSHGNLGTRFLKAMNLDRVGLSEEREGSAQHTTARKDLPEKIASIVRRSIQRHRPAAKPTRGGLSPFCLRRVTAEIDARIDQQIHVADLARIAGLSTKHFARSFRRCTGTSPHQCILLRRVEAVARMLTTTPDSSAQIALACGFADQSHMTATFRKITGMTPGAFRRARMAATAAPGGGKETTSLAA